MAQNLNNNNFFTLFSSKKTNFKNEKDNIISDIISLKNKHSELYKKVKDLEKQIIARQNFWINMEGLEFETYICDIFIKLGYYSNVTKATRDEGADIIAKKDNIRYAIQCKNYKEPVGNHAIQEVFSAKTIYNCDKAIVISNSTFTNQAISQASKLNVILIDRNALIQLLHETFKSDFSNIDLENQFIISESTHKNFLDFEEDDDIDPLLMEAIEIVIDIGQASTSLVQRKLKVGYARAGRIIDQMEARGIISEFEGTNPRQVLITREELNKILNKQ